MTDHPPEWSEYEAATVAELQAREAWEQARDVATHLQLLLREAQHRKEQARSALDGSFRVPVR